MTDWLLLLAGFVTDWLPGLIGFGAVVLILLPIEVHYGRARSTAQSGGELAGVALGMCAGGDGDGGDGGGE